MKSINKATLFFAFTIFMLPLAAHAESDSVVVIVNKDNQQSLTQQQIKNIYSDIVTRWDNGKRISVLNLPVDSPERESFSQEVFGETSRQLAAAELNRKITNSIKNPSKTKRARLILKKVARDINAIGYISKKMLKSKSNVRVLLQIR